MSVRSARYNLLSLRNPKGLTVIPEERDAWAFLDNAQIRSSQQQRAIIQLVRELKHAQLWSKMKAIYPFVGGTATTHKFNLKDPRDLSAAFRLQFFGGWTHSNNGVLPNGTTAFADTNLTASTSLTNNSTHLSYYSRTAAASGVPGISTGVDIGALNSFTGTIPVIQLVIRGEFSGSQASISNHYSAANQITTNQTSGQGLFVGTRTSSNVHRLYKNTTNIASDLNASNTNVSSVARRLYIAARNDQGSAFQYSNKESGFISIGDGLTGTDVTALYNIVQRYQTSLGRQV